MNHVIGLGPTILATFLASLVEFVEALTIVLAVGTVRGWRAALLGTALGVAALVALVVILGPLLGRVPLHFLQLVIGLLLLLFGMRWLRKAILRNAGVIPRHDETAAFARETAALRATGPGTAGRRDPIAIATTFKAVFLEGLEVVFIVIAAGTAGERLWAAAGGAAAALVLVLALGAVLHRPLARVPENALKLVVGVLISAFGIFWVAQGFDFHWGGEDWAIAWLSAILLIMALGTSRLIQAIREPGALHREEER